MNRERIKGHLDLLLLSVLAAGPDDRVELYLDQLYVRLRTTPRDARRIIAEAEDHLRESAAAGLAAGLTEGEAQEAAISSFGSVQAVVRAHAGRVPPQAVLGELVMAAWKLGSILGGAQRREFRAERRSRQLPQRGRRGPGRGARLRSRPAAYAAPARLRLISLPFGPSPPAVPSPRGRPAFRCPVLTPGLK